MVVMGISIGTRLNGIAVIAGNEFEAAQMFSICGRWSPKKIDGFLRVYKRYIRRHRVSIVVIKIPKPSHFTLALKQLIRAVDTYVKKQGCLIEYTTIEQIKKAEPSIKNRNDVREFVVATYPELLLTKHKDIQNKQPYYMKLFEATIVAHIENMRNGVDTTNG